MKLFFNFFISISISISIILPENAFSREIIVVTYNKGKHYSDEILSILLNQEKIPLNLISTYKVEKPCEKINDAIIHICVDDKMQVHFPKIDRTTILKSFKIFKI